MFTRRRIIAAIIIVGLAGAIFAAGSFILLYIEGGSGEASRDIEAKDIACGDREDGQVFTIVTAESEVRFILDEELGGQPTTVVGTTDQVAGQILIDVDNPANSCVGPITINLRTLKTDRDLRDRQIRANILKSAEDEYEFTDFVPTRIEGLPASVTVGEPFSFTVIGDLTLVDSTNEVSFAMTVTPLAADRISGSGAATVSRGDYNLEIPNVRGVANVSDEVALEIDFVAVAVVEDATTPADDADASAE